jgi:hypothetical protein
MSSAGAQPQTGAGSKAPGSPVDAATAFGETLFAATKVAPADTADPHVSAAFALGWQMAELYRPRNLRRRERTPEDLPGLSSLDASNRIEISVDQVQAGITKLAGPIERSGLAIPNLAPLRAALDGSEEERAAQVLALHRSLLGKLTASDFRLGKAYGLGRALADTCLKPTDQASFAKELGTHRLANLLAWLDDLSTALPAHSAHSVASSLARWRDWATTGASQPIAETLATLRHQGQLWRALLSGEKSATGMLEIGNYLDATRSLLDHLRTVLLGVVRRLPVLAALVFALLVGGIVLLAVGGASQLVAGASSILVAVGLTWKGLGSTLGQLAGRVEQPLWGAALDDAVTDAITLLPGNTKDNRGRRALALAMPTPADPKASDGGAVGTAGVEPA